MRLRDIATICVLALMGCFAIQASGQTVVTGAITPTHFCPGDPITVPFSTTGTFQPKNAFTAQLSNQYGNFDSNYTTLGSTNNPAATSISSVIPVGTTISTHYRVRVISGRPYIPGSDNGSDLTVGGIPKIYFVNASPLNSFVGDTVHFTNNSTGGSGATYLWNFGADAIPETSTDSVPPPVVYTSPGAKTVTFTVTSAGGCSVSSHTLSADDYPSGVPTLGVYSCDPAIPNSATIDSVVNTGYDGLTDTVWIVPGGLLQPGGANVVFIEAGGNLKSITPRLIVYVKAGGTCQLAGGCTVIYEDGAGITGQNSGTTLLKCSSLNFDYTNAPPYHLPTLGVNEKSMSPLTLSLYPNPANDMLHVFTGSAIPSSVRLFNALGETVWSAAGHLSNNVQVPTDDLRNGVYYLQVTAQGKMSTEKVTVIH